MFVMNYPGNIKAEVRPHQRPSWLQRLQELSKQDKLLPKVSSLGELDVSQRYAKLPQIASDKDTAFSDGDTSARATRHHRERNMFAQGHADKGVLFKTSLSTSLPDLPSLSKPQGTPRKFEKLSFKKRIHDDEQAPAPGATIHAVTPLSATGVPRLPAIKTSVKRKAKRRHADSDILNIYNTTDHTVEYYEHDGHVYVGDRERKWKEDCACRACARSKAEWLERKQRKQRRIKNSMQLGVNKASPVKELCEEPN